MLLYHRGSLFGKTVDEFLTLAQTTLAILIVCFREGLK